MRDQPYTNFPNLNSYSEANGSDGQQLSGGTESRPCPKNLKPKILRQTKIQKLFTFSLARRAAAYSRGEAAGRGYLRTLPPIANII